MKKIKKLRKEPIGVSILCAAVLVVVSLLMIYPLLLVLNVSLKSQEEFITDPSGLFGWKPFSALFANYANAFDTMDVFGRLIYTVVITVGSAAIACVVITLVAYPLARKHFKGSDKVFGFILVSMFFPGSLVANIFLVQNLGLYNSPFVLLIFWGLGGLTVYIVYPRTAARSRRGRVYRRLRIFPLYFRLCDPPEHADSFHGVYSETRGGVERLFNAVYLSDRG